MWHAFATDQIKSIGMFLDAKSLTQYQTCSQFCLSGNTATYKEYKKLYKDGLEACQVRMTEEWGFVTKAGIPWPHRLYLYKVADARLDFLNSLKIKRVFVRIPPKFHREWTAAWDAAFGPGS